MRIGSELFFETHEVLRGVDVVVGLAFVQGEAKRTGALDRLVVDGLRGPRYVAEELFVWSSHAE